MKNVKKIVKTETAKRQSIITILRVFNLGPFSKWRKKWAILKWVLTRLTLFAKKFFRRFQGLFHPSSVWYWHMFFSLNHYRQRSWTLGKFFTLSFSWMARFNENHQLEIDVGREDIENRVSANLKDSRDYCTTSPFLVEKLKNRKISPGSFLTDAKKP